jgi:hypothetical protein
MMVMIEPKAPNRIIIILGMHRSGTSCLTGSLQQGGLELGEFSSWNPHNLKGNRENNSIMSLHESILADNNSSWFTPSNRLKWQPSHKKQAREILEQNAKSAIWGFKDPRTLFTLDGWLSLGIQPEYVGIYRSPAAVVQSLLTRSDTIDQSNALKLWYSHNIQLLKLHKKYQFPLLSFDWDEEKFNTALGKLHLQLGLTPLGADERFFENNLRHNQDDLQLRLPWKVSRLYNRLNNISDTYYNSTLTND